MICPRCQQTWSEFQSLCPNCFGELVKETAASGTGRAESASETSVAWPEVASFATMAMPEIDMAVPDQGMREMATTEADKAIDRLAERIPDVSARDVVRQNLDRAAQKVEQEFTSATLRDAAHDRLQGTVEKLAEKVPDVNLRQEARKRAREAARRGLAQVPDEKPADWGEQLAREAGQNVQRRVQQADQRMREGFANPTPSSFEPWKGDTPTTSANVTCGGFFMAVLSLMVPGLGQVVYGPRLAGVVMLFLWFVVAVGGNNSGLWFMLALTSFIWTLVTSAERR